MSCIHHSLPYPTFLNSHTVTSSVKALSGVGRVRVYPSTCPGVETNNDKSKYDSPQAEYHAIIAKNKQQSSVDVSDKSNRENAKLRKKYMKEGVAMAYSYLRKTLGIDVSVVSTEIVLSIQSILETEGCLASCFLDSGCAHIVIIVKDNEISEALHACDVTGVPKERLILQWKSEGKLFPEMIRDELKEIEHRVGTISIQYTPPITSALTNWSELAEWKAKSTSPLYCLIQLSFGSSVAIDDVTTTVASISKVFGENKGSITLVDPTAQQLGLSYAACLKTDRPDGLYATVVCTRNNEALGLVYSSKESIIAALECGRGVYWSRSRGGLWRKGDTSGRHQTLHKIDADCDADALRFMVTQHGEDTKAFCHLDALTCWGEPNGVRHLERTLAQRLVDAPAGSYTKRLFDDDELLRDKLVEEAEELSEAKTKQHVAEELADVLYFSMVKAVKFGVSIDDAVAELDKRAKKVTRRKGDSKRVGK